MLESTDVSLETCWGLGERRIYGYDTTDDGVIDDVALEEMLCDLRRPDEQLYGRNILYYQDGNENQFLETLQQLSTQGIFRLFHATDLNEFETTLEEERVDVVVFMRQGGGVPSSETQNLLEALVEWVSNEGRLIFSTFNDDENEEIVPTALEVEFTERENLGEASFSSRYLGWQLDSPSQISNPASFATFSRGLDTLNESISVCDWENSTSSCAVLGNEGRTLMTGFLFNALDSENQRQFALNALAYVLANGVDDIE